LVFGITDFNLTAFGTFRLEQPGASGGGTARGTGRARLRRAGHKTWKTATWAKCFKRFKRFMSQRAKRLLALGISVGPHVGFDARRAALGGRAPQSL
jgi:hypothetical protein